MTGCCQNIKAYTGFTQDQTWHVVMVSGEKIPCECQPHHAQFDMKPPFSTDQWQDGWKQCQDTFFKHRQDVCVVWEQDVSNVLKNKASSILWGKVQQ